MRAPGLPALALVVAVVLAAGCRREAPHPPDPPQPPAKITPAPAPLPAAAEPVQDPEPAVDDATITARVNAALLAAMGVPAADITVTTVNGVVQLSGFVAAPEQVERAGQLAGTVGGVREVQNNLGVRP
jgi:hypothetical protein